MTTESDNGKATTGSDNSTPDTFHIVSLLS
jgi:hypothetical protein